MKRYISLISVLLTVCLAATLTGCSLFSTEDEKTYGDVEGGKALTRYEGNSSNQVLEIPDEIDGVPVVEIGEYGVSAAEYLVTIRIGKNVRTIHPRAFCGTYKNLAAFEVDPENPYFCSVDGVLFNKEKTILIAYPNKRVEKGAYVIPEGVVTVRSCAFFSCDSPASVTLASTVKEVEDFAFFKCGGLTTVVLNEGLEKVGQDGFSFCESLTSLCLPSTLRSIGDYGFYAKTSKLTPDTFTTKVRVDALQCGKGWRPQKTGMENSAINPSYVGA